MAMKSTVQNPTPPHEKILANLEPSNFYHLIMNTCSNLLFGLIS